MPPYRNVDSPPWGLHFSGPRGAAPLFTITVENNQPGNIGYAAAAVPPGVITPAPVDVGGRLFANALTSIMSIFFGGGPGTFLFTFRFDATSIVAWRTANLAASFTVGGVAGDVVLPIASSVLALGNTGIRWTEAVIPGIGTMWPFPAAIGQTFDVFFA